MKTLIDGERRCCGAVLVGIEELDAILLDKKPSASELHIIQMSLEAHKVGLSAMGNRWTCCTRSHDGKQLVDLTTR